MTMVSYIKYEGMVFMGNRAVLEVGKVYRLQSSFASDYKVLRICSADPYCAILQQVVSKWTFRANGTNLYEDGRIDWDYSSDGYFAKEV